MRDRPGIAFVSTELPQPFSAGTGIRIRHLLQSLASVGDVHWIGYGGVTEMARLADEGHTYPWLDHCATMRVVPWPAWSAHQPDRYRSLVRRKLAGHRPVMFADFPVQPLQHVAAARMAIADLVWVERIYAAEMLGVPRDRTIVDVNDLDAVKASRQAELECTGFDRWAMGREAERMKTVEATATRRFSRLAVCSEVDAAVWPDDRDRVWVVPNGTDDALFDVPRTQKIPGRIVFVGTMSYWPNEQGIGYFMREIFPRLIDRVPDISLELVGRAPPESIRRLHDGVRVLVRADVESVVPHVQQASLSIVPLLVGGGTRLKTLESLALGTPVVSTTVGAEGLDLRHGRDLLLADAPGEFAAATERLLSDPALATMLAERGRQEVADRYRWSQIRRRLADQATAWLENPRLRRPA